MVYKLGKNHPMWKGGRKINSQGYILIYSPEHPYKDNQKYVREHRLVMEKKIGRYLRPDEVVHHINGNKTDNRPENLQILLKREHDRVSVLLRPKKDKIRKKCPVCKTVFPVYPSLSRLVCCSTSCSARLKWRKGQIAFGR